MMNECKFIYVYSDEAKDTLSEAGFVLLQADLGNGIYVFINDPDTKHGDKMAFALDSVSYITSNTLLF